jgi:hypothetical protein
MMTGIGGVLAGALAAFMGAAIGKRHRDEEDDDEEPLDQDKE